MGKTILESLKTFPMFGGVNDAALTALAGLMKEENFPAGKNIIKEGADGDTMYLLLQGTCDVIKTTVFGDEYVTATLLVSYHVVFGEMALIDEVLQGCRETIAQSGSAPAAYTPRGELVWLGGDRETAEHLLDMGYSRVESYDWNDGMGQYNRRMAGLSDKNYCMRIWARSPSSVVRYVHVPGAAQPVEIEQTDPAGISRSLGFEVKLGWYCMWK